MIKSIDIQNYALIESLEINFSEGLNIITGETGAGKSILLGALGLIMGKRADKKALYDQSKKCIVEVDFDVSGHDLSALYTAYDIDIEDELTIRRMISPSGKSKSYVNDTPVTLNVLVEFTDVLVDLHQQFDTLQLHNPTFQLNVIDALADNIALFGKYKLEYKILSTKTKELDALKLALSKSLKEQEYYQFLGDELANADFQTGEQDELEKLQSILGNAEEIKSIAGILSTQLSENENSISSILQDLIRQMSSISKVDPRFEALSSRLEGTLEEVKDISSESEVIFEDTNYEDQEVVRVDDRLDLMYKLFKKHNVSDLPELMEVHVSIDEKLHSSQLTSENIDKLEEEISSLTSKLRSQAEKLSARRKKLAPKFEKDIHAALTQLAMPNAELKVSFKEADQLGPNGLDHVTYMFSANKGGALNPIKNVASGGEISRLTLSVKSIVASALKLPTMIFDEIDTGISGAVAHKMGEILLALSKDHQVISITHSPQIASKAQNHFFVYKDDEGSRTKSAIKLLDQDERVLELAKMLSGDEPTAAAIDNAREMLG